jgi:hypothetical protein
MSRPVNRELLVESRLDSDDDFGSEGDGDDFGSEGDGSEKTHEHWRCSVPQGTSRPPSGFREGLDKSGQGVRGRVVPGFTS